MISTQYIKLNMTPSGALPVLYCSQYDVGRPLGLVVHNGSEPVDLDTYTVTIEATRTDGTPITAAVTTDDNIGVFVTTAEMTNKEDKYFAKLVLFDSNSRRVASLAFVMVITPATMDENAQPIQEDRSLYQQYTEAVQALIAEIRTDVVDLQEQKIQRFDTVAQMKADTSLKVGMYARTGGYYAVNDGGGALYRIYASAPSDHYETLTNGLYARMIVVDDTVNCKQFGIRDGDDCASLFTSLIANYDNVIFEGNYVCGSTITVTGKGTSLIAEEKPRNLYFKSCVITLTANVNMFEFVGTNINMYDGEFIVGSGFTFNHAVMYLGPQNGVHALINVYRPMIKSSAVYTGNKHSDYESQLKQFDTAVNQHPTDGAGIMLYGSTTSPVNATVFCNFVDYVIEGFGIAVYLLCYSKETSAKSYFNSCKFIGKISYSGKGYVLIGDNRFTSGYPCDIEFSGEYQTGAQTLVSGDLFDNIIYGGRQIVFDVRVWDSARRCCETHESFFTVPTVRVLEDANNIEGFNHPQISNPKGRFSSCIAMDLEYSSTNKSKYCVAHLTPSIVNGERILSGIKASTDSAPEVHVRYAGNTYFSIENASVLDFSFKMKHTNSGRINVLVWARPYDSEKFIIPNGVYPLVRNVDQMANIVTAVNTGNRTITISGDYTPSVGQYCIPEGHKYRNITYNNNSSPMTNAYTGLPKVTAVDGNVVTLDSKMDDESIVIGQQVTFASTGNVEYSEEKLIGSRAPQISGDYDIYSFTDFDLSKLAPYKAIMIKIQFYHLGTVDSSYDYMFKDMVLNMH